MTRLSNLDINRMSLPKHVLTTKRCSEQHCSKGFWKSNGICVDLFVAYNTERCSPIYSITGQKLWHCVATCQYESFSFSHRWNTAKHLWQHSLLDKVYFLVNFQNSHTRVVSWALWENILPVELCQYWLFQYWSSSTGSIFSSIDPVANSGLEALKICHRVGC